MLYAFATAVPIALYTLIDAIGVRTVSEPLTYIAWTYVLAGICFPATVAVWRPGTLPVHFRDHGRRVILAGTLIVVTYTLAYMHFVLGKRPKSPHYVKQASCFAQ